jgi:hypothetical protein
MTPKEFISIVLEDYPQESLFTSKGKRGSRFGVPTPSLKRPAQAEKEPEDKDRENSPDPVFPRP